MKATIKHVETYLAQLQKVIANISAEPIDEVIEILLESAWNGRKVFICGNGGSASTASHFACDLSKNTIANICQTRTFFVGSTISPPLKLILDDIDRLEKKWKLI